MQSWIFGKGEKALCKNYPKKSLVIFPFTYMTIISSSSSSSFYMQESAEGLALALLYNIFDKTGNPFKYFR